MKRMIISIGIGFSLMHSAITLSAMRTESLEEHTFCQLVDQIPFAMKKNLSPRRSHENNQSSQVTIEKNN